MLLKKFPLLLLLFAASYYSHAQSTKILKDTTRIRLRPGTAAENARYIIQTRGTEEIKHTPNDIPGYRLRDGRTYVAFTIQTQNGERHRYFFERIASGLINFYYLVDRDNREAYYISSGGSELLKELSKGELYETLKKATENCPGVSENAKHVKLARYHLARFSEDYNRCTNRAFPRFRVAVKGGINQNTYNQQEAQESSSFPRVDKFSASGFSFGVSIDHPVAVSNLSLNAGLMLDYYHGSGEAVGFDKIYSLTFEDLHVSLPVGLRYSFYGSLITPFIETDLIYSQHLSGSTTLYEFEQEGNSIFLTKRDGFLFVPKQQVGFGISAGAVIFPRKKHSILLQGDYRMMRPLSSSVISTHINMLSLSVGFVF